MKPKNVVLDVNIWISFFIKVRINELRTLLLNDVKFCSSPALVAELEEVLQRKKFAKYLKLEISEYIDLHNSLVSMVYPSSYFDGAPDPDDNYLFDIAFHCNASHIVTGDKKILAMRRVVYQEKSVELLSLTEFLSLAT